MISDSQFRSAEFDTGSRIDDLLSDPEFVAEYTKARFVEDVYILMSEQRINKAELASRLNKSRQYVGKVLNENANFTVERLAEFACALDAELQVRLTSRTQKRDFRVLDHIWPAAMNKRVSTATITNLENYNERREKATAIAGFPNSGAADKGCAA